MRKHIRENLDSHLDREKMVAVSGMQSAFATSPTADREPLSAAKALVMDFNTETLRSKSIDGRNVTSKVKKVNFI